MVKEPKTPYFDANGLSTGLFLILLSEFFLQTGGLRDSGIEEFRNFQGRLTPTMQSFSYGRVGCAHLRQLDSALFGGHSPPYNRNTCNREDLGIEEFRDYNDRIPSIPKFLNSQFLNWIYFHSIIQPSILHSHFFIV